jgi:hypothetical protein
MQPSAVATGVAPSLDPEHRIALALQFIQKEEKGDHPTTEFKNLPQNSKNNILRLTANIPEDIRGFASDDTSLRVTRYLKNQVYTPLQNSAMGSGKLYTEHELRTATLAFIAGQTQETCTSEYGVPRTTLARAVDKVKSELGYAELKKGDVVEMYQNNTDNTRTTIEAHVLNMTTKKGGRPPVLLPMELAIEAAKADLRKKNLAGLDVKTLQVPLQAVAAAKAGDTDVSAARSKQLSDFKAARAYQYKRLVGDAIVLSDEEGNPADGNYTKHSGMSNKRAAAACPTIQSTFAKKP